MRNDRYMKYSLLLFFLLLFLSCSSDSTESDIADTTSNDVAVNPGNSTDGSENTTEILSVSILVSGEYFNDTRFGMLFLSDAFGNVIAGITLNNNSDNMLEIEVDSSAEYDMTLFTQELTQFNTIFDIHTFTDVSSGAFLLEEQPGNGNGDTFSLSITKTGYPLESINISTEGVSLSTENGGSYQNNIGLSNYPGNLYAAFQSPQENMPRYYFGTGIERSSIVELDYLTLPFIENKIVVDVPRGNYSGASFSGFVANNGKREKVYLGEVGRLNKELYFPDGIFENYEISALINCCSDVNITYRFKSYGPPSDLSYTIPTFEADLIDPQIDSFLVESIAEHDYSTTLFIKPITNIYDDTFKFHVHSLGKSSLSFSKQTLLANIMEEAEVNTNNTNDILIGNVNFINNSNLSNDYTAFIQSIIGKQAEFPSGTVIRQVEFSGNNFIR